MYSLIKKVVCCPGVSGNEKQIAALLEKEVAPYVDETYTDALGNLIAIKYGNLPDGERKKLLYCENAHSRRHYSVAKVGASASYDMSESCKLGFNACLSLNLFYKCGSILISYTLGNDYDKVTLAKLSCRVYLLTNSVSVIRKLGDYASGRACGNCSVKSK